MGRIASAASTIFGLPLRAVKDLAQIKDGLLDFDLEGKLLGRIRKVLYSATLGAALDALGAEDPDDQITGAVIMIAWSFGTSLITGPFAVALMAFWTMFLAMGVFRYSDDGERAWTKVGKRTDISIPGSGLLSRPKEYATRSRRGGED
ncbi:hypothetical protein [Halorubellus sp. PRR65]|uniref:hypothetical protein n=1 Tax=Halorubellus sp. PRR65 TaxID=3098148 RepID=UPI002B25B83C|nr:hypothetical protein [Halorubellus sp. PRR65]